MSQKSVRILHPWMPLYRESFFRKLISLGVRDNIRYEIYAGSPAIDAAGRNDQASHDSYFTSVPTHEYKFGNRSVLRHTLDSSWKKPDLIIAEQAIRNLILYRWVFMKHPPRIALWGHGKTYTKANTKLEEWLKTKLVNRSDWFFGYTQMGVDSVVRKGFKSNQTTVVQNSTDTRQLKKLMQTINAKEINDFRVKFGIGFGPVGVFIGALDPSKRLDFLIESVVKIQYNSPDFQMLIFGDGPELESVLASCEEFSFIKYCGRADQDTQALISKVAKLIMMPGRVGLIAVDSFALGLPIVTTKWPWHAPEFEYLSNGRNSVITGDTLEEYSLGVINLIRDELRLNKLRNNCLEDAKIYTIERMALNFHEGVMKVLGEAEPRDY